MQPPRYHGRPLKITGNEQFLPLLRTYPEV
jgi:hypothetical protein